MSGVERCPACGREIKVGKAGSLTQWIFSEATCECGAKLRPSLPEQDEPFEVEEAPGFCEVCGKLKSSSNKGSLTQWVFSSERCSCDAEKLAGFQSGSQAGITRDTGFISGSYESDIDDELKAKLESDEVDYHGLAPDSFPFKRYRIIEETGRGNAGIVFIAWDLVLKKKVAIKTLYSDLWSAEELMRLQKEAKASSRLNHPNVLRVLDFGASANGQPYMVMEYVKGETLAERLDREGPLPLLRAMEVFFKICTGVRHAHKQGVFHRDLKPSNIMIEGKEPCRMIVKVIDFGIAAVVRGHEDGPVPLMGEQLDTIAGSPAYMSPDQIRGGKFDQRSDVYSIGCIMFECLTGRVPFLGRSALSTLNLHASEQLPSLQQANPGGLYPADLELIVRRCLEKDPDFRFQTVDQLYATLREFTAGGAIEGVADLLSQTEPAESKPLNLEVAVAAEPAEPPQVAKHAIIAMAIGLISLGMVMAYSMYLFHDPIASRLKEQAGFEKNKLPDLKRKDVDVDKNNPFHGLAEQNPGVVSKYDGLKTLVIDGKAGSATASGYRSVDAYINRAAERKLSIEDLEINSAKISPDVFPKLAQFEGLEKLTLARIEGLSDSDLIAVLPQLQSLKVLRLRGFDVSDSVFKAIGELGGLHEIELDAQTKITPKAFEYLKDLPIDQASFKQSKLTHEHFEAVSKIRHLEILLIGDSGMTDDDLAIISRLPKLHVLGLNGTLVTDKGLMQLARDSKNIATLYAFRCPKITQAGADRLIEHRKGIYLMNESTVPGMANWGEGGP